MPTILKLALSTFAIVSLTIMPSSNVYAQSPPPDFKLIPFTHMLKQFNGNNDSFTYSLSPSGDDFRLVVGYPEDLPGVPLPGPQTPQYVISANQMEIVATSGVSGTFDTMFSSSGNAFMFTLTLNSSSPNSALFHCIEIGTGTYRTIPVTPGVPVTIISQGNNIGCGGFDNSFFVEADYSLTVSNLYIKYGPQINISEAHFEQVVEDPQIPGTAPGVFDAVLKKSFGFKILLTGSQLDSTSGAVTVNARKDGNIISTTGPIAVANIANQTRLGNAFTISPTDMTNPNVFTIDGSTQITFEVDTSQAPGLNTVPFEPMSLNIHDVITPKIAFIPVNGGSGVGTPTADEYADLLHTDDYLSRLFPVQDHSIKFSSVSAPISPFGLFGMAGDVVQLEVRRLQLGQDRLVGVVSQAYFPNHPGESDTTGVTFQRLHSVLVTNFAGNLQVVAHELAHSYGYLGEDYVGANYNDTPVNGFDGTTRKTYVFDKTVPDEEKQIWSIMGPSRIQSQLPNAIPLLDSYWIDNATYSTILQSIPSLPIDPPVQIVSGILSESGQFTFGSSAVISNGTVSISDPSGDVQVSALDINDNVLSSVRVQSDFNAHVAYKPGAGGPPTIDIGNMPLVVTLPYSPAATKFSVSRNGIVIQTASRVGQTIQGIIDGIPDNGFKIPKACARKPTKPVCSTYIDTDEIGLDDIVSSIQQQLNSNNSSQAVALIQNLIKEVRKTTTSTYDVSDASQLTQSQVISQLKTIQDNLNKPTDAAKPVVRMTVVSSASGTSPFTAVFDSSGTFDPKNLALSYQWDFGDGSSSTANGMVTHAYTNPGHYSVTLTVTNSKNRSASASAEINVIKSLLPPVANITVAPSSNGMAPFTATFSSAGSSDPQNFPVSYLWEFGDGGTATGVGPVSHQFLSPGIFNVALTVTNSANLSSTVTTAIVVSSPYLPPIAVLSLDSSAMGLTPYTATFDSLASFDFQGLPLTFAWNFGDGATSTVGGTISHQYATAGTFTVTLVVTDSAGLSGTAHTSITVSNPSPPVAALTVDSSSTGNAPFTATFDGFASYDPQGWPLTYTWNFGDGVTDGSGATVSHQFQTPGQYTVTLTVTDGANLSGRSTTVITVQNSEPPVANLVVTSASLGVAPFSASFDPSLSYDPQGLPLTYAWDFGDGATSNQSGTMSHIFADAGQYNVTLTVTNSAGLSNAASVSINVLQAPVPFFVSSQFSNALTENFNGRFSSSPNGPISSYQWDFGDQTSGSGSIVQHTYAAVGTYSVTLTVTDVTGASASITHQVVISPVPTGATAISVGLTNACAIVNSGLRCLGDNSQGQVGNGLVGGLFSTAVQVIGLTTGVQSVGVGDTQTCAVQNGQAFCWGNGVPVATAVPGLSSGIKAISAGFDHACAIQNGGVFCWGSNAYGQLGNGTTTDSASPVAVAGIQSGAVAISAGHQETCALFSNGSVMCWGRNDSGQLGDGTTVTRNSPVQPIGLSSGVTVISEGYDDGCAVQNGGALCWGGDVNGHLGTTGSPLVPSPVTGLTSGVHSISAGQDTSLAAVDGDAFGVPGTTVLVYWGFGNFGPGNHGGSFDQPYYARDVATGVSVVSGAGEIGCGIWDGVANCWGYEILGSKGFSNQPVDVGFSLAFTPGPMASFTFQQVWGTEAVNFDGSSSQPDSSFPIQSYLWNFGDGSTGSGAQINHVYSRAGNYSATLTITDGSGATGAATFGVSVVDPAATGVSAISVGLSNACAIRNGALKCLGDNTQGQVGNGVIGGLVSTAIQVSGLTSGVQAVSVADTQTCAAQNGAALCWGNGTALPTAVPGLSSGVQAISAGYDHSCAIQNGGVLCWGSNAYGQLGNGTTIDSASPVPVAGLQSGAVAISSGHQENCALLSNGSVMCWGRNDSGQLGDGTTTSRSMPVQPVGLSTGVTDISEGYENGCAIQNGGALCWGGDSNGQLGTTGSPLVPSPVKGLTSSVHSISAGQFTTLAVTDASVFNTSGSTIVVYWGFGNYGPGNHGGSYDNPAYAFDVSQGVSEISGGGQLGCGIWSGAAYCWGYNILGNAALSNQPIDVGS